MREEEMLYKALFPKEQDPNYINYGYFVGKNKNSVYKFKTKINDSQINPVVIYDKDKGSSFYAKVLQGEVDSFLEIIGELDFREVKIAHRYIYDVKYMFGDN